MAQFEENTQRRGRGRPEAQDIPRAWWWALVGVVGVVIVGLGDLASGREVSFSVFYVVPIALTAWMVGRPAAIAMSVAAAAVWLVADRLAGTRYSAAWIGFWNSVVRLGFFLIISLLVDHVRRMHQVQSELARVDPLTGVSNTRTFVAEVTREISRAGRYGHLPALLYVDLDDFKAVNDRDGHHVGDETLRRVADVLRSSTRSTDVIGRMGGDEFAVLLPEVEWVKAKIVAEKLLTEVATRCSLAVSIGVVTCDVLPNTAEDLIRAADEAMYAAKRSGKNRVEHRSLAKAESQVAASATATPKPLSSR